MNATRFQKVKDIFAEAVEQSPADRAGFLRERCGTDENLLREIESLIAAHEEPANLIEANALNFAENGGNYQGKTFGNYKIVREIGHGGMGAVFLAKRADGEFDQQVALKIVRQTIASNELERHFRRERQILASLNHPNIAKLLDGGVSENGEPFLVMEFIEGKTLLEFAADFPVQKKLELFLKICSAVAYAHRNLVVHRDIKPSNILVTNDSEPKLLDFGLAKITGDDFNAAQTATVFRAFTPSYASPEQIHGSIITTASDVYSLGVVLYELLTGVKPFHFEGKSIEEIFKTIDFQEPLRPSSVSDSKIKETEPNRETQNINKKLLVGDLDNITLKALRREPERRYKSVEAFADDIERHLKGLPVSARANTLKYRAAKFFQRNKIIVSAAGLVVSALVFGLAIALWQANAARLQRDRAEKRFSDVRELSNALLFKITPKIERLNGSMEAREALVGESLKYLDSLASESSEDLTLQSELAAAYEKIGDLQGNPTNPNFVEFEGALKSYEKANQMRRNLIEKNANDADSLQKLAENHRVLGNIYSQTNDIEASSKNTVAALQIYAQLVAENPLSSDLRFSLAKVNYDFGLNLQSNKKHSESLAYFEKAKTLLAEINREKPDQLEILQTTAEVKIQNAYALSWAERQPEAETEAKEAILICQRLIAENPNNVAVRGSMWLTLWLTSGIYQEQNDKFAYEFALKALKIVEETVARDGANIRAKQQLAKSYSTLGQTATTIGKSAEAVSYLEKSCRMLREITETTAKNTRLKSDLALALRRFGGAKTEIGALDDALVSLREAEKLYLEILRIAPDDRRSNRNLADTYEQFGNTFGKLYEKTKTDENRLAAKSSYQKAFDILSRLESQNALAEADRKYLAKMKSAVEKYQR